MNGGKNQAFWLTKRLDEMTPSEWESLCDGCGKCCLIKLEDIDTGDRVTTSVGCKLLDTNDCRCSHYEERTRYVPDCVILSPKTVPDLDWMPKTCAYRLVARHEPLPWWHPLVSGSPQTVHDAGISVRGRVISESDVPEHALQDFVIDDDDPLT